MRTSRRTLVHQIPRSIKLPHIDLAKQIVNSFKRITNVQFTIVARRQIIEVRYCLRPEVSGD